MATSEAKDAVIKQVFEVIELLIENDPNALELVNNIIIIPIEKWLWKLLIWLIIFR